MDPGNIGNEVRTRHLPRRRVGPTRRDRRAGRPRGGPRLGRRVLRGLPGVPGRPADVRRLGDPRPGRAGHDPADHRHDGHAAAGPAPATVALQVGRWRRCRAAASCWASAPAIPRATRAGPARAASSSTRPRGGPRRESRRADLGGRGVAKPAPRAGRCAGTAPASTACRRPTGRTSRPTTSPGCGPTPVAAGRAPYVVAVGGRERRDDLAAERRYVASIADAGADWWQEYVPPRLTRAEARRRIVAGPSGVRRAMSQVSGWPGRALHLRRLRPRNRCSGTVAIQRPLL